MTVFTDLGLIAPLTRAITEQGYETPTPIQQQAIPLILEGRDVLGLAQTGTGKTAAFALPSLQRLASGRAKPLQVRALILTPTRELAHQVAEAFAEYGRHLPLRRAIVHGGVAAGPQIAALHRGVDILIATPGRAADLMNQGHLRLDAVELLVLDEADRMLDMGFLPTVKTLVGAAPAQRQTLLFSATLPDEIAGLAGRLLTNPARVQVNPVASTAPRIDQKVLFVAHDDKPDLLHALLTGPGVDRAIVFTRTKHGANRLAQQMERRGVKTEAIHGNKSQAARLKALAAFRDGSVRALVATDIAARGIDVDGVTHVINFDLPNEAESYVHRIGRTARAGAAGIALSLCVNDELAYLRDIEKIIQQAVPVDDEHAFHCAATLHTYRTAKRLPKPPMRGGGGGGGAGRASPARPARPFKDRATAGQAAAHHGTPGHGPHSKQPRKAVHAQRPGAGAAHGHAAASHAASPGGDSRQPRLKTGGKPQGQDRPSRAPGANRGPRKAMGGGSRRTGAGAAMSRHGG